MTLVAVALLVCGWAIGDDSGLEAVFKSQGLARDGQVYVLADERDLHRRVAEVRSLKTAWNADKARLSALRAGLKRARARYDSILQRQGTLENVWQDRAEESKRGPGLRKPGFGEPPPPPPDDMRKPEPPDRIDPRRGDRLGEVRREYASLEAERTRLEANIIRDGFAVEDVVSRLEARLGRIERRVHEAETLADKLQAHYGALARSSDVVRALASINETASSPVRLGPATDERASLDRLASELASARRELREAQEPDRIQGMNRLRGLAAAAEFAEHDLALALGHYQSLAHEADSRKQMLAGIPQRQHTLTAQLARATDAGARKRLDSDLAALKSREQTFQAEQAKSWDALAEALDRLAETRDDYLQIVAALGKALENPPGPDNGSDARQQLLTPLPGEKVTRPPTSQQITRRFHELSKAIKAVNVRLDVDKAILWTDVSINAKATQKMIVDPGVDDVRLSARSATAAGIGPNEGDRITITMADRRSVEVRRVRLASVKVESCTASDVECIVLPETYGDAPPVLGGSYLKRFGVETKTAAGTLTLTQVQVKPDRRTVRSPATKSSGTAKPRNAP